MDILSPRQTLSLRTVRVWCPLPLYSPVIVDSLHLARTRIRSSHCVAKRGRMRMQPCRLRAQYLRLPGLQRAPFRPKVAYWVQLPLVQRAAPLRFPLERSRDAGQAITLEVGRGRCRRRVQ